MYVLSVRLTITVTSLHLFLVRFQVFPPKSGISPNGRATNCGFVKQKIALTTSVSLTLSTLIFFMYYVMVTPFISSLTWGLKLSLHVIQVKLWIFPHVSVGVTKICNMFCLPLLFELTFSPGSTPGSPVYRIHSSLINGGIAQLVEATVYSTVKTCLYDFGRQNLLHTSFYS